MSTLGTKGPVLIIGTGLLGASLGLALRSGGIEVYLDDISPTSLLLARDLGAGQPRPQEAAFAPSLVIVATPPDIAGQVVLTALEEFPEAIVTDVASVKSSVAEVVKNGATEQQITRYVGSHPMAGRERSGTLSADVTLFTGRTWVVVPTDRSTAEAILSVRTLASDLGCYLVSMGAAEHDRAVALVSHVPQLVSSLLAARLAEAGDLDLELAGGGLRDTTRIAASEPRMWTAITMANAPQILPFMKEIRGDLDYLIGALGELSESESLSSTQATVTIGAGGAIAKVLHEGNEGVARIPGKHGGAPQSTVEIGVALTDRPGELSRLLQAVETAQVNIEDLRIEHAPGQALGLAWLVVAKTKAQYLMDYLEAAEWRLVAA
ncbi:hypothetical protein BSR29_04700 [Boudabousia liubingyangii]|uniref:Prephenate/arogenate dehydrogenase domain-containing protein n=1 Tax=Boudabousia liubingyangii TaxID=1921764 RepID=A0A1Q5PNJ8_9ACTO|nr:prephenate dehydrogenase [Boudabousia liubingyangii]OKL49134.1 hypothetical protein BSR29_04700 [Boudabousia liubingyangii]